MNDFRDNPPTEIAGKQVLVREDYVSKERIFVKDDRKEEITLPTSNVLKYKLENDAWVCIRPSGTEPKIKFYFGVREKTSDDSNSVLTELIEDVMARVKSEVVN